MPSCKHQSNRIFRTWATRCAGIVGSILTVGIAGVGLYAVSPPPIKRLPLPQHLIALDSTVGQQLLSESTKRDYPILAKHFQAQTRPAYCGVASAVIILNALKSQYPSYHPLDQNTFFTPQAQQVRPSHLVTLMGMSLAELAALLKTHGQQADVYYASATTLTQFRTQVQQTLSRDDDFIVVNYNRARIGQVGGGHISPIAAYHAKSDRVLIQDVSPYKYPPVWIKATDLWAAMQTVADPISGQTRGYLVVH